MADNPSSSEDNLAPTAVSPSSSVGSLPDDAGTPSETEGTPSETERTPFDVVPDPTKSSAEANEPLSGWPAVAPDSTSAVSAPSKDPDRSSAVSGCSTGALSLMPFLFVLAIVRAAGLPVDASSMVAVVAGAILMAVALKSWPRRTMFWLGGYAVGLLVAYALLWFLVRPLLTAGIGGAGISDAPAINDQSTVPVPNSQ